jgi:hypothetical protein
MSVPRNTLKIVFFYILLIVGQVVTGQTNLQQPDKKATVEALL